MKELEDSDPPASDSRSSEIRPSFESVLSHCIEGIADRGFDALEESCRENPELEARLRDRIAALSRAGLLPQPAPPTLVSLGRYRILDTLGRGAMGVVHLAEDRVTARTVALKTLPIGDHDVSDRARARFVREGRVAQRLSHPHIVTVFDVGEEDGVLFYAMEPIDGITLAQWLHAIRERGSRPEQVSRDDLVAAFAQLRPGPPLAIDRLGRDWLDVTCHIVIAIARALAHIHSAGIVHRDVKPSNVLIARDGRVLLFDLGLAHLRDEPALTRSGDFAGSPYYASPEQIGGRSHSVDERSDVYSLGVTLYEMLTLRLPFAQRNAAALAAAITEADPPPIREAYPTVPIDLVTVCETALEKDPAKRYSDAASFAEDIERVLGARTIRARPATGLERLWRQARRRPAVATTVLLVLVILVASPIALLRFNRAIARERDQAEAAANAYRREAERNQQVSSFWEELVLDLDASPDPDTRSLAHEFLNRGIARAEGDREAEPLARAAVLETLGRVQATRGRSADAIRLFDPSLTLRTAALGESHLEVARILVTLAATHLELGDLGSAEQLATRCVDSLRREPLSERVPRALGEMVLAEVEMRHGEFAEACVRLERAIQDLESVPDQASELARALELASTALSARSDWTEAQAALERALALRNGMRRPRLSDIARAMFGLGEIARKRGDLVRAEERFVEALAAERKASGDVSREVLATLEALDVVVRDIDPSDPVARRIEIGGRLVLLARNRRLLLGEVSRPVIDRAIALLDGGGADSRIELARARLELAIALEKDGQVRAADELLSTVFRELPDDESTRSVRHEVLDVRIALARELEDRAGEERLLRERVAEALRDPSASHAQRARSMLELARMLRRTGSRTSDGERERADHWEMRAAEEFVAALDGRPRVELRPELDLDTAFPRRFAEPEIAVRYDETFQRGIIALQSQRPADAASEFVRCLELVPRQPTASYNLACALAQAGDPERSFSELVSAAANGFGLREGDVETLRTDSDLQALRAPPWGDRLEQFIANVEARRNEIARAAAEPSYFVPPGLDLEARSPLLVVAHRHGSNESAIIEDPTWRAVAIATRSILVAASGSYAATGPSAADGAATWIEDVARFRTRSWHDDRPLREAVEHARRRYSIDPSRIVLCGEGVGGLIAFDVAVQAPGVFRGVLLCDATLDLEVAADRSSLLADLGVRIVFVPQAGVAVEGAAARSDSSVLARELSTELLRLGIDASVIDSSKGSLEARLVAALERVDAG